MGKTKIYELAKELKVENKELLEIAQKLGIKATSHLSAIEEKEVSTIKENISKNVKEDKKVEVEKNAKSGSKKQATKSENSKKDDIKTTGQVIIRREVIVEEDEKKNPKQVKDSKTGIGFTERRNKDYNIVYREKPTKPMTVNELFGIKPKTQPKKEVPVEVKEDVAPKNVENKNVENNTENKMEQAKKMEASTEVTSNKNLETKVLDAQVPATATKNTVNENVPNNKNNAENNASNKNGEVFNKDGINNVQRDSNYNRNGNNSDFRNNNYNRAGNNGDYRNNNYNRNGNNGEFRNNNYNRDVYNRDSRNNNYNRDNNNNGFNRNSGDNANRGYRNNNGDNSANNGFQRNNDRFNNRDGNSNGYGNRTYGSNNHNNGTYNSNNHGTGTYNSNNRGTGTYNSNNRGTGTYNSNNRGTGTYNSNNRGTYNSNNSNGGFNRNNNNNGFRKPFNGGHSLEKDIKDIATTDFGEKDNQRDYSTKIIDKQKANRNFEEKKKASKSRRIGEESNFDEDKLRDLKQADRLSNMFEDQEGGMLDYYDLTTERGKKNKRRIKKNEDRNKQKIFDLKSITIPANISVKDLATELKKTATEVIKTLFTLGIMASINQTLDFDTAYLVADSMGIMATKKEEVKDEDILFDDSDDNEEDLQARPPVVVVMGHVDHGKTSLLDAIRKTNVIEGEAGGITQHIGAYKVNINGREITFLDTPGHEAFTSMRARGAQITDIAILVVAADDGVMPQTIEAINHAKAAGIPIIVAVNKIDLPGANVDKVKQELMKYELVSEEWGGDTIFVPISAKNNINIDNLLEMVLLVADMQNLRADPNKQSKGTVIEARLDKAQGPIASVLIQRGTLNIGDTIILGSSIGKIRTMKNDKGKNVKEAGPSTPVEITGLHDVPEAGDTFYEVKNEKIAKHLIEQRKLDNREKAIANNDAVTLDNLFEKMESEDLKQLNIIVKTDVQGTAEALKASLEKLSDAEVRVKVIHSNAGGVTESDVELAKAANAIIIAFNVRPVGAAKKLAEKEGVEIKQYSIIYQALEDIQDAMKGMLAPIYKEKNIGNAEVRQTFKVSNVGTIAGCFVTDGKLERNAGVRVIRDSVVIHDGKLISLKRFKDDAKEVSKGFECGLQIEGYDDLKEGDTIEAYIKEEVKR